MSQSSASASAPTAITWHSHYSDPAADITLVSNDGIHFKVSSYYMCKASGLFSNMKEAADNASTPIQIDISSKILETFLGIIHAPDSKKYQATLCKIEECLVLLPLCDFFDSKATENVVRTRMEHLAEKNPTKAFARACDSGDLQLAKFAILHMDFLERALWDLKQADNKHIEALLRSISTHLPQADQTNDQHRYSLLKSRKRKHDDFWWQKVVDDFNPKRTKDE